MTERSGRAGAVEAQFPDGFLWGAATAAYQIEGAVQEDGRGESIWDRFSHAIGRTANGDTGDVACDHYHRWQEDIGIMRELGLAAYRFSIAWPRIIPEGRGAVNQPGLDFYERLVEGLLEAGITPWATMYHWDLPQVLEDAGGWPERATADAFAEYADVITSRLGDRVKHWITINEPWVVAYLGYGWGVHAPGRADMAAALATGHSLLLGHGKAVEVVRSNVRDAEVGITLNLSSHYPATDSNEDLEAAHRSDGFGNRWFLDPVLKGSYPDDMVALFGPLAPAVEPDDMAIISQPTDFLGINYYSPTYVRYAANAPMQTSPVDHEGEKTEMGWLVEPRGLRDLLVRLQEDYAPPAIYVTENGAAFADPLPENDRVADPRRLAYIHDHLLAAHEAIGAGAPLRGYFCWSLLDNFEWAEGYTKRFGVTYIDYATQTRTIKDSGRWYRGVTEANAVVEPT
jgi:beta-glucosidase